MKNKEEYKRVLKLLFSFVLISGLCSIYAFIWIEYYNAYIIQNPFFRRGNWVIVLLYGVLLIFFLNMYGGFKIGYLKNGNLIYSQIISVVIVNTITYVQIAVIDKRFVNPAYMLSMTVVDILIICIWTFVFEQFYKNIFPPRKMLFVAGDRQDYHLKNKMNSREDKYEISKIISHHDGMVQLKTVIDNYDGVIVGDIPSHERNEIFKYCFDIKQRIYIVPKISDILLRSSDELNLFDTPLLLSRNTGLSIEQQWLKRLEDIFVSITLLIIFLPFFLILSIAIKLTDGGPIFYKQERWTKDGKTFMIYKFRSMIQNAEKLSGIRLASEKDERILPIGKILRKTRLDELPQLWNVLKGDMSMVGPRPERPSLAREIEKDIPEFRYRLKVKAGLTGYAQIYGKYNTMAYDKLKLDLIYIRKYSILLDFKLMIMTPKIMLMKESSEGVKNYHENRPPQV